MSSPVVRVGVVLVVAKPIPGRIYFFILAAIGCGDIHSRYTPTGEVGSISVSRLLLTRGSCIVVDGVQSCFVRTGQQSGALRARRVFGRFSSLL